MLSAHEKSLNYNTLIGIIKACVGKRIQIDLRNETHVYGQVESVFSEMNVIMSDAYFISPSIALEINKQDGKMSAMPKQFSEITIRGSNIRFVHIPDEVDMISALGNQILSMNGRLKQNGAGKNEFKKKPRNLKC